ncbi:MAG: hypothetical protein A2V62_11570 [Nitrospirae bacterium RBG_19FT_COMBO_58_9]|nr:MAG: hypothetical protein A2V62_11570 [Nitrospirae bacterium RBG_19FT_COMBO_58_9]
MQIQPIHQTVGQLLSGRLFKIPQYQRAYSWGRKQREDLLQDIEKVYKAGPDASHFMATIVGLRKGKLQIAADEFVELDIVDGQQRLTTLVLLLKAIEIELSQGDAKSKKLSGEIRGLLIKGDDLRMLLLQTNHDASQIFVDYVRGGRCSTGKSVDIAADKNLVDGIEDCTAFVKKWVKSSRSLIELVALLRNRISLIFHEIEDEGLVYSVFEVLNSRGLDVTWFDKLKSLLMAIVFEHGDTGNRATTIDELHNLWREIYRTIGLRQTLNKETVRFAGTLKAKKQPNRPLGEESAVDELVSQCDNSAKKAVACSKWILQVTKAEEKLLANHRLRSATQIVQARLTAVAIILREFPEKTESSILRRWENVTFRIYGLFDKDGRTAVGDYVRLAWKIHNELLSPEEILESLAKLGEIAPIEAAVKELMNTDCYSSWTEELRYFLFRHAEFLAKSMGQQLNNLQWNKIWQDEPSKSIEHIKPQSSEVAYIHRLGNLTILPPGVNSKLQDKDPRDKAKTYESCGLLDIVGVAKMIGKGKWDRTAVERREQELIKWAMTEWAD